MEYPRWGPEEQEHLQILKATLSEEGLFDGLPPYEDAYGDRFWLVVYLFYRLYTFTCCSYVFLG